MEVQVKISGAQREGSIYVGLWLMRSGVYVEGCGGGAATHGPPLHAPPPSTPRQEASSTFSCPN
ncbi:hypothetical protein E2C01_055570 [Portunus trituberculatus]|uniref:Uncharacterized protein n=1 Tax=Portunus trituberculatus TaxID=210409 RepID=A0A5B7GWA5_PORTR|nr:hypothetical protein [Portunus trituberculatus]